MEIAEFLFLDNDTIRGWHKAFLHKGWKALARGDCHGGHSRLTPDQDKAECMA